MRRLVATFTFIVCFCLWAVPLMADGELAAALKNREEFLSSPEKQKKRAAWLALIKEFEAAAAVQPQKRHEARGKYMAADLAYQSGRKFAQAEDFNRALKLAKEAVRACSNCPDAPAAQLLVGRVLLAQKNSEAAWRELMKVELNHPGSSEVAEARRELGKLGGAPNAPNAPKTTAAKQDAPQTGKQNPPKAEKQKSTVKAPSPPKARSDGKPQVYFYALENFDEHSRVTVWLDKVSPYVYNLLPPTSAGGRFRAYVDFKGAKSAPNLAPRLKETSSLISLVKINQFNDETVRLVVDLPEAYPYLPTFLDNPPRLIFSVAKEQNGLPAITAEAQPAPEPAPPKKSGKAESAANSAPAKASHSSIARQLGLQVRRVIIDPGHGGKDHGAVAFSRKEKEIVLKAAKLLKAKIEKRLGLAVVLTRGEDVFITLDRRVLTAKNNKADLFISIHANANASAKVEGVETYILNFATDNTAMAVAARENAGAGKSMAEMQSILELIAKNSKVAESRILAQNTHKRVMAALRKKYKVRDLGVKEAPFFVLVGANVPSMLVEIGFLTNQNEAARLAEDAYLDLLTDGLTDGLAAYIKGL